MRFNLKENEEGTGVTVIAAVFDEHDKVLILQRGATAPWEPNKWSLVGGMMEKGENPVETVVREVKEETGLDIWTVKFFKSVKESWGILKVYTANSEGEVVLDYENSNYAWISYKDIDKYEYVPTVKEILLYVLDPRNW